MSKHDVDLPPSERKTRRFIWGLVTAFCIAMVAVGAMAIALYSTHTSSDAKRAAQSACLAYKNVAEAPITKVVSPLGLTLAASFRIAYDGAACADRYGALSSPDPRVKVVLDNLLRRQR